MREDDFPTSSDAPQRVRQSLPVHVVIWGPSEWGQKAAANLSNFADQGIRITFVVADRDRDKFESLESRHDAFRGFGSLKGFLDRDEQTLIDYVYDSDLGRLAAQMCVERNSQEYFVVSYVASSSEDHFRGAAALAAFSNRVLIEKPLSRILDDVVEDGPFERLAAKASGFRCELFTDEHLLFRPAVEYAINPTRQVFSLDEFLDRHSRCGGDLSYKFNFHEAASKDDPNLRLPAYQDGALLDMTITHGMGPLAQLIWPRFEPRTRGRPFHRALAAARIASTGFRALGADGKNQVAVFAETGAIVAGSLESQGRVLRFELGSAKGAARNKRFFEITCNCCGPRESLFGVSLASNGGITVRDRIGERSFHEEYQGGHLETLADPSALMADAQANMLYHLIHDEKRDPRFISVADHAAFIRVCIGLRRADESVSTYTWGTEAQLDVPASRESWREPSRPDSEVIARLRKASKENERVFTIYGPEGSGKHELADRIEKAFKKVAIVRVADSTYDRSVPGEEIALGSVCRKIASLLNISLPAGVRASEYLADFAETRDLEAWVVLLGISDRNPSNAAWVDLMKALTRLHSRCPELRIIFMTTTESRIGGDVIRVGQVAHSRHAACSELEELEEPLRRYAENHAVLNRLGRVLDHAASGNVRERELLAAALGTTPTVVPFPLRQIDTITSFTLAHLTSNELENLRVLAGYPSPYSESQLDALVSGTWFEGLGRDWRHLPLRLVGESSFEFDPEVPRVLARSNENILAIYRTIQRRLLLLNKGLDLRASLRSYSELARPLAEDGVLDRPSDLPLAWESVTDKTLHIIQTMHELDLSEVDFSVGEFEQLLVDLLLPIVSSRRAISRGPEVELVQHLLSPLNRANLSLDMRALLEFLLGWALLRGGKLREARRRLRDAACIALTVAQLRAEGQEDREMASVYRVLAPDESRINGVARVGLTALAIQGWLIANWYDGGGWMSEELGVDPSDWSDWDLRETIGASVQDWTPPEGEVSLGAALWHRYCALSQGRDTAAFQAALRSCPEDYPEIRLLLKAEKAAFDGEDVSGFIQGAELFPERKALVNHIEFLGLAAGGVCLTNENKEKWAEKFDEVGDILFSECIERSMERSR